MSERMQLREPLFKLVIRFGNGETIHFFAQEPIESRQIASDTRYAVISCFSLQNPSECTDVTVLNLRDVSFIKSERVTLDQAAGERRTAGLHAGSSSKEDDRLPKTLAQLRFI